jgi:hypothetical protein
MHLPKPALSSDEESWFQAFELQGRFSRKYLSQVVISLIANTATKDQHRG